MARAGIGHPQQVQGGLDAAVLSVHAVEAQEHQVRPLADLQHMGADVAGALVSPAALHRLQVRRLHLDLRVGAQTVRCVEQGLQVLRHVLQPQEQIHQDGPVAVFPQGPAHAGARHQGHRPLRGDAPRQYYDLHSRFQSLLS